MNLLNEYPTILHGFSNCPDYNDTIVQFERWIMAVGADRPKLGVEIAVENLLHNRFEVLALVESVVYNWKSYEYYKVG